MRTKNIIIIIFLFLFLLLIICTSNVAAGWWCAAWDYNTPVTIDDAFVGEATTNFPILINISSSISSKCEEDGSDIRFIDATNETEFAYHFAETWDSSRYNLVFVNVTSISNTADTIVNIYYGNGNASDNQDNDTTWGNGYKAVYYMNETSGSTCYDYSGNNYDATYYGSLPTGTSSYVGTAQYFDGIDDYILLPSGAHIAGDGAGVTMEVIHEGCGVGTLHRYFYFNLDGGTENIQLSHPVSASNHTYNAVGLANSSNRWLDGGNQGMRTNLNDAWFQTYMFWGSGTVKIPSYNETLNAGEIPDGSFTRYSIGVDQGTDGDFKGSMDFIRLYDEVKSDAWLRLENFSVQQTSGLITYGSETMESYIDCNASTNRTESSATLHGFCVETGSANVCGFWLGTTSSLTEDTKQWNISVGPTVPGFEFQVNTSATVSLADGETYYVRTWRLTLDTFYISNDEISFTTIPQRPGNVTLNTNSEYHVDITWTKEGEDSTTVIVHNNKTYIDDWSEGTIIYNGTGSSFEHVGVAGEYPHYKIWSYLGTNFSYESRSNKLMVPPAPPNNISTNVETNNSYTIYWTKGEGADRTLILRSIGSYPSGPNDATATTICNTSDSQQNIRDLTSNYYYSAWSWDGNFSESANFTAGGLVINCYDEETNDSIEFDVQISDKDGTESYESNNNTNSLILNLSLIPTGDDVMITISASQNYSDKVDISYWGNEQNQTTTYIVLDYIPDSKDTTNVTCYNQSADTYSYPAFSLSDDLVTILPEDADTFTMIWVNYSSPDYASRIYYRDIVSTGFYVINAYLPDDRDKFPYTIRVVQPSDGYTNPPIPDADVAIKTLVNGTYVTVSSLITDGAGEINVYLIPDKQYKVTMSKSGFETITGDFRPDPVFYGAGYPKIFEMSVEYTEDEIVYSIWDFITFNATMYKDNTSIHIQFHDRDSNMTNLQIYTYQGYNNTLTLLATNTSTGTNTVEIWLYNINISRQHVIWIYFNQSTYGFYNESYILLPLHSQPYQQQDIEEVFEGVLGPFKLGYVVTFLLYIPCIGLLVVPGPKHPGFAIILSSLYAGLLTSFVVIGAVLLFIPFIIVIGGILMAVKGGLVKL